MCNSTLNRFRTPPPAAPPLSALRTAEESTKKRDLEKRSRFGLGLYKDLCFVYSLAWAVFCACAAADASIRIDFVDIALGNSFNRANRCTSSASNTIVVNYVSHFFYKNFNLLIFALHWQRYIFLHVFNKYISCFVCKWFLNGCFTEINVS